MSSRPCWAHTFVQVPFTYSVGPYSSSGEQLTASEASAFAAEASEYTLTWALDNYAQIDPVGSYQGTLRVVDLQYAHNPTKNAYWYASLVIGYEGLPSRDRRGAPDLAGGARYRGQRLSLFHQTETNVRYRGIDRDNVSLVSMQVDSIVGDHVYIPLQASVAHSAYLGYPGYGELLAGVGLQNRYAKGDRFQFFGQLLAGTNVHGLIVKGGIGLNVGLTEQLAIHASAGTTHSIDRTDKVFKADYAGLGLTYRFAVPSW